MAGSFNRLLAKAPKRRLQRRGGAWQEGDFYFRGCFGKKKVEQNEARRTQIRVSGFKVPLLPHGLDTRAVVGRRLLCLTKHYRPCTRAEFVFDFRTTTRLPALFSFSALRSLFSRFNSSLNFIP